MVAARAGQPGRTGPRSPAGAPCAASHGRDRGDRPEGLDRAPQHRHAAGRVQRVDDLRRRLAGGERDEDRKEVRAIGRRAEQRLDDLEGRLDLRGQRAVREVVDEGEDVVGAGSGERPERGVVGGRRIRGAPGIERVADVAERRQIGEELVAGRRRDVRQVDARSAARGRRSARPRPVETVTTPVRPRPTRRPSRRQPATSSAVSSRASRSSQRITPAARSAASVARVSPASEPEWATAASCAWRLRPTLTAMTGLPAARARSARARNRSGRLNPSRNRITAWVSSSSIAWARKSQTSRTTSLPQPTIREKPIRVPEWMNASVTDPDWAIPMTPPRGSHGFTSPMYVALFVVRSTRPMQFGPSRAMPCRRASSRPPPASGPPPRRPRRRRRRG